VLKIIWVYAFSPAGLFQDEEAACVTHKTLLGKQLLGKQDKEREHSNLLWHTASYSFRSQASIKCIHLSDMRVLLNDYQYTREYDVVCLFYPVKQPSSTKSIHA
jgi:hypothetical protein